jgi:hypothetical protein
MIRSKLRMSYLRLGAREIQVGGDACVATLVSAHNAPWSDDVPWSGRSAYFAADSDCWWANDGALHTFFLSAYYCNEQIGTSQWRTSDFADTLGDPATPGCVVFGPGGVTYPSINAAAVDYWFFIQDESGASPPATLRVDRLSVQNWMWDASGAGGRINCSSGNCV